MHLENLHEMWAKQPRNREYAAIIDVKGKNIPATAGLQDRPAMDIHTNSLYTFKSTKLPLQDEADTHTPRGRESREGRREAKC